MPLRENLVATTLGAIALSLSASTPAWAETNWAGLTGTWRGTGLIREYPTSVQEQGVCKFKVNANAAGTRLSFDGRCANASQSGRVSTQLERNLQDGSILATSQASNIREAITLKGEQNGRSITLASVGEFLLRGQHYSVRIDIEFSEEAHAFTMEQTVRQASTGQSIRVLEMIFLRQTP
ncbi:MAG: hypothetical protein AAGD23_07660 [Pseudomonadota bacterium]